MVVLDEWHVTVEVAGSLVDDEADALRSLVEQRLATWASALSLQLAVSVRVSR